MKQETLEEVAERFYPTNYEVKSKDIINLIKQDSFKRGAKWQAKRMYTEEEVLNIINNFCDNFYENSIREDIIVKWFEQFKNK
jgi:hypothetical protein